MILKISLRPLDKFFFGGEGSFKEGENDDSRRSTYLLHSRYFPQQTGVLGLIRNQLLLQSGLLSSNAARMSNASRQKAKVLIGNQNFVIGKTDDFGVIQKISPVFLLGNDGAICTPAPLDDRMIPDPDNEEVSNPITFHLDDLNGKTWPRLLNYREKEGLFHQIQHSSFGNSKLDNLFLKKERVGISKAARPWGNNVKNKDDEEGYYYQTFLQFFPEGDKIKEGLKKDKPPFFVDAYVFFVQIKEQVQDADSGTAFSWAENSGQEGTFTLRDGIVEFGGERSSFQMQVEKMEPDTLPTFSTTYRHAGLTQDLQGKVKRLVCLSPAYVDPVELRKNSHLIISEAISFRFLSTDLNTTENYQHLERAEKTSAQKGLVESKLHHLLERGSVVYFDAKQKINHLFDLADFQKIGYNQYHIL